MTVTETVSTNGGYKVFSINDVRDLPTAIAALINELEGHNISMTMTQFVVGYDSSTTKPIIMAFCR